MILIVPVWFMWTRILPSISCKETNTFLQGSPSTILHGPLLWWGDLLDGSTLVHLIPNLYESPYCLMIFNLDWSSSSFLIHILDGSSPFLQILSQTRSSLSLLIFQLARSTCCQNLNLIVTSYSTLINGVDGSSPFLLNLTLGGSPPFIPNLNLAEPLPLMILNSTINNFLGQLFYNWVLLWFKLSRFIACMEAGWFRDGDPSFLLYRGAFYRGCLKAKRII